MVSILIHLSISTIDNAYPSENDIAPDAYGSDSADVRIELRVGLSNRQPSFNSEYP